MKSKNERNVDPTSPSNAIALAAPDLWARIHPWHERLRADRAFTARLRATLPVDDAGASAAILEFLRFAYLAWTSPVGATPSKAVDGVWHELLLFTRSYDAFCRDARGEHLHHEPGDGASDEERYRLAYLDTLARYEIEFGTPDARWWPRPMGREPRAEASAGSDEGRPFGALALSVPGIALTAFAWVGLGPPAGIFMGAATAVVALAVLVDRRPSAARPRSGRGRDAGGGCSSGDGGFVPVAAGDGCPDGGGPGDGGGSCGSGCGGGGCGGA